MSSGADDEAELVRLNKRAARAAKRAATLAENLEKQKAADAKMVEDTQSKIRQSKAGAQGVWRKALGTSTSGSQGKRPASPNPEANEAEKPAKIRKTEEERTSSSRSSSSRTKGDKKKKLEIKNAPSPAPLITAPPKAASLDSTDSEAEREASNQAAASKKDKSSGKKKEAASDREGGSGDSSEADEDEEDFDELDGVSDDEDDNLAAGNMSDGGMKKQFANEAVVFVERKSTVPSSLKQLDTDGDVDMKGKGPSSASSGGWRTPPQSGAEALEFNDGAASSSGNDGWMVDVSSPPPRKQPKALKHKRNIIHEDRDDSDEDQVVSPPLKTSRKREPSKKDGKRIEAFRNEQPKIATQPSNSQQSKGRLTSSTDSSWPSHANITPNAAGGEMKIREQDSLIATLIRDGIEDAQKHAITVHAWPEVESTPAVFRLKILLQVTKNHREVDPRVSDVMKRIKADQKFAKELGDAMISRLSTLRTPIKTCAVAEIAGFMLGKGDRCIQRVAALVDKDNYIFPGDWVDGNVWKPDGRKPYMNEAILDVLKNAFFKTTSAVGYKYKDSYVSSLTDRKEPELPVATVALAATGIYAALAEWAGGKQQVGSSGRVGNKFEGNLFIGTYRRHEGLLNGLRRDSPIAFHAIMSDIYTAVIGKNIAAAEKASGAWQTINVSHYT